MKTTKKNKKKGPEKKKSASSRDFYLRVEARKNKWHVQVVSKSGRMQMESVGFSSEIYARKAAVRILNCLKKMPDTEEEDIQVKIDRSP